MTVDGTRRNGPDHGPHLGGTEQQPAPPSGCPSQTLWASPQGASCSSHTRTPGRLPPLPTRGH